MNTKLKYLFFRDLYILCNSFNLLSYNLKFFVCREKQINIRMYICT